MKFYLFIENCTGEEFAVEAENYDIACGIANGAWEDYEEAEVEFCYRISELELETMGIDVY